MLKTYEDERCFTLRCRSITGKTNRWCSEDGITEGRKLRIRLTPSGWCWVYLQYQHSSLGPWKLSEYSKQTKMWLYSFYFLAIFFNYLIYRSSDLFCSSTKFSFVKRCRPSFYNTLFQKCIWLEEGSLTMF